MPMYCAATRPKFLNVYFFSFSNPVACLDDMLENLTYLTFFIDCFVFSCLPSSTLMLTSLHHQTSTGEFCRCAESPV